MALLFRYCLASVSDELPRSSEGNSSRPCGLARTGLFTKAEALAAAAARLFWEIPESLTGCLPAPGGWYPRNNQGNSSNACGLAAIGLFTKAEALAAASARLSARIFFVGVKAAMTAAPKSIAFIVFVFRLLFQGNRNADCPILFTSLPHLETSAGNRGSRFTAERLQSPNNVVQIKSTRVINIDMRQANGSLFVHEECARNRQFSLAACAIGIFKRMAELSIKFNQFVAEFKYDSKPAPDLIADAA